MLANDFDTLLRERIDDYTPEYNPAAWQQLTDCIPPAPAPRRRILWLVPVGIAASLGAGLFLFLRQSPDVQPIRQSTTANPIAVAPHQNQSPIAKQFTTPVTQSPSTTRSYTTASTPSARILSSTASTIIYPARHDSAGDVAVTYPQQESVVASSPIIAQQKFDKVRQAVIDPLTEIDRDPVLKKTTISLAGGLQYGTLNAGYAAGINVRRKLGRRWSVEADMSYVKYTSSGTVQMTSETYDRSMNAGFAPAPLSKARVQAQPIIQYIQATPGVAYGITDAFSVGAAVDLQRVINESEELTIRTANEDLKLLPSLDIGAAARAEFRISNGLKAGLIYRQGINNLVQSGHNYIDRRYLQVQVRIPLISR